MKPRLLWTGVQWMCWSRAIFGGRVVGFGPSPQDAYREWEKSSDAAAPSAATTLEK
jgi:hypothetical protein